MRLIQFDKTQDVREPSKWIRVGTEVSSKESNSQLQWKLIGSQYSILLISLRRALIDEILDVRIIVRSQRPRTTIYQIDA
jgi:hypothetical protein